MASDEVDDVVTLMVESRIDPQKFAGNLRALLIGEIPSMAHRFQTGEELLPTTPSIVNYVSVLDRPPKAPLCLLAGFSDVFEWYRQKRIEMENARLDEEKIIGTMSTLAGVDYEDSTGKDESYYRNAKGQLRARYYRNLASNYQSETDKPFEVSVEDGSEDDTYMGVDLLEADSEESNFALIAAMTTKYYLELRFDYDSWFPDETSLITMAGVIDANVYVFETEQVTVAEIIDIARRTEGQQDHLLNF